MMTETTDFRAILDMTTLNRIRDEIARQGRPTIADLSRVLFTARMMCQWRDTLHVAIAHGLLSLNSSGIVSNGPNKQDTATL